MRIARKRNAPYIILIEINLRRLVALLLLIALLIGGIALIRTAMKDKIGKVDEIEEVEEVEQLEPLPEGKAIAYYGKKMNYRAVFNDVNDLHLEAARKVGLASCPESRDEIENGRSYRLVHIESNKAYKVDDLTHSVPYVTPSTAKVIGDMAVAFRDSIARHELPQYRFIVTSVLRTQADVKRLRKGNVNATQESAHCYATTFDISYAKYEKDREGGDFMYPYDLTKILAEVLRDFRDQGRIYVKYESKQPCFHITCRQ